MAKRGKREQQPKPLMATRRQRRKARESVPPIDPDLAAFAASNKVDQIADYANRGRKHRSLSDQELVDIWIQAFKAFAADPTDMQKRAKSNDLDSEFEMRRKTPPYSEVALDVQRLGTTLAAGLKERKQTDPAGYEAINKELEKDISVFKTRRKGSN